MVNNAMMHTPLECREIAGRHSQIPQLTRIMQIKQFSAARPTKFGWKYSCCLRSLGHRTGPPRSAIAPQPGAAPDGAAHSLGLFQTTLRPGTGQPAQSFRFPPGVPRKQVAP